MKVILDDREHALFEKCRSILDAKAAAAAAAAKPSSRVHLSKTTLVLGDILFTTNDDKPVLLIERKSFADLLASITDGRYEEQSYRLSHASEFLPHFIYYVLEGMFSQLRNPAEKNIIMSAAISLSFFKGFSVHRTATIQETAEWILHMADKIEREFEKGNTTPFGGRTTKPPLPPTPSQDVSVEIQQDSHAKGSAEPVPAETTSAAYCSVVKKVKKENVTPENIGEIVLCQIPGISTMTAVTIMQKYRTLPCLLESLKNDPKCLENVKMESGRKINKTSVENIRRYFLPQESLV